MSAASGTPVARSARGLVALACAAAALSLAGRAHAQLQVEVLPVFGEGCTPRTGPTELVIGLSNPGGSAASGTIRVEYASGAAMPGVRTISAVPFSVGARGRATVRVQTPPQGLATGDATLRVNDGADRVITQRALAYPNPTDAMIVDATPQARLAFALRAASSTDPYAPPTPTPLSAAAAGLTPCPALRVPHTGEVVLPRTLAGYTGVAMVVVDAATVMSLGIDERVTLADFVLTGGTVAVIPSRPDELRHATLAALVGAGVTGVTPPPLDPSAGNWIGSVPGAAAGSFPLPATLQNAQSFQGGNLHYRTLSAMFPWGAPNLLGASAEYGRGHVHVLSFNAAMPPALEDPWAVALVARLAQQSGATRAARVVTDGPAAATIPTAVRRWLDPNEGFRGGLGLAVILLILYAVFAGPVAFKLFARRGRPGRGLAMLPLWSALVFVGIVTLGGVSRGWQGRARRFGVIEMPAGMPRGAVRRFHGYYSGDAGGRVVRAAGHDRRLYADPSSGSGFVTLQADRSGATLRGLATTPWTTAVVREEAMETLGGSVTIQPDPMSQLRVVNRTRYALRNVIVLAPGGAQAWSFAEVPVGRTVLASSGAVVPPNVLAALTSGMPYPVPGYPGVPWAGGGATPVDNTGGPGWQIAQLFGGAQDTAQRWDAFLSTASRIGAASPGEPVVLGQLVVPLPRDPDGDLRVDQETLFVRVSGWGGAS